ncbi:MAG: hypothetical protein ABFD54_06815 [Armatimonadota bacterium]|nr:hypothetical protein [bacterium]
MTTAVEAARSEVKFEVQGDALLIGRDNRTMLASLRSPRFNLGGLGWVGDAKPVSIHGDVASGKKVEIVYAAQPVGDRGTFEVKGFVQWSAKESILRKWASYKLVGLTEHPLLSEVVLEDVDAAGWDGKLMCAPPQSYPVFSPGLFVGIEYPVAFTRLDNGRLILAHKPGIKLAPGTWYETKKAVYGVTSIGREKIEFRKYVALNRPEPKGLHIDYNSWWTSPCPYSEESILEIMHTFRDNLYKPYGVSFDSFCIDMGWSASKSPWDINKELFPSGFDGIKRGAEEMKSHLGLWISPSAFYSPGSIDTGWMKENGYETLVAQPWNCTLCCLGGKKYQALFKERLLEMATQRNVRQFKFDGYYLQCSESDHGHEPGDLSCETIAEGAIEAFDAVHKAEPTVWMESTCFGWDPSPWWLFHVNSVLGTYGDDAPHGRVPCPIYRESYTTTRDYFNLQGAARIPVPIIAQELLGIVHQTNEPLLNDAVATVMRGHMFLPMYINPRDMNPVRWKNLADLIKWARANSDILQETLPIMLPSWQDDKAPLFTNDAEMPREVYGYIHGNGKRSLIELRNPWIAQASHCLTLDEDCGLSQGSRGLSVVSLYPEVRLYGKNLSFGDTLNIPLAPYETLVLSVAPDQPIQNIPAASADGGIKFTASKQDVNTTKDPIGIQVDIAGEVEVTSPLSELLFLVEDTAPVTAPTGQITIDGSEVATSSIGTAGAWTASSIPPIEHWVFLRAPLTPGKHTVGIKMNVTGKAPKVSAWAWTTRLPSSDPVSYPNALPSPEMIYVGSASLLEPVSVR